MRFFYCHFLNRPISCFNKSILTWNLIEANCQIFGYFNKKVKLNQDFTKVIYPYRNYIISSMLNFDAILLLITELVHVKLKC